MKADKGRIWVDADACPAPLREVLIRAAQRAGIETCFVSNHFINIPNVPHVSFRQVEKGFDIADHYIAARVDAPDLVVTQDIPLAAEVIEKGAIALGPRGQLHTADNIKARLTMRNFMETMRSSGVQTGGPKTLSKQDIQQFANQIDRWIAKVR